MQGKIEAVDDSESQQASDGHAQTEAQLGPVSANVVLNLAPEGQVIHPESALRGARSGSSHLPVRDDPSKTALCPAWTFFSRLCRSRQTGDQRGALEAEGKGGLDGLRRQSGCPRSVCANSLARKRGPGTLPRRAAKRPNPRRAGPMFASAITSTDATTGSASQFEMSLNIDCGPDSDFGFAFGRQPLMFIHDLPPLPDLERVVSVAHFLK